MAFINLLHNGYQGKLGETVGQKWKNQRTVRTYNPHNNSKSKAQLDQRAIYKQAVQTFSMYYTSSQNYIPFTNKGANKFNCYFKISYELYTMMLRSGQFYTIKNYKDKNIFRERPFLIDGEVYLFVYANKDGSIPKEKDLSLSVILNITNDGMKEIPAEKIEITGFLNKSYHTNDGSGRDIRGCLLKLSIGAVMPDRLFIAIRKKEGKSVKLSQMLYMGRPEQASIDDFFDN